MIDNETIDMRFCVECGWRGFNIFENGMAPSCPKCRGKVDKVIREVKNEKQLGTDQDKPMHSLTWWEWVFFYLKKFYIPPPPPFSN